MGKVLTTMVAIGTQLLDFRLLQLLYLETKRRRGIETDSVIRHQKEYLISVPWQFGLTARIIGTCMSPCTYSRDIHVVKFYDFNDCRDFLVANDGIFLSLYFGGRKVSYLLSPRKWSIIRYTIVE
jgi:hypothetical protein